MSFYYTPNIMMARIELEITAAADPPNVPQGVPANDIINRDHQPVDNIIVLGGADDVQD